MRRDFSKDALPLSERPFLPSVPVTLVYPYLSLLEKCTSMRELRAIHAHTIVLGLARYTYITSRILAFCAISGKGCLSYACQIFDQIPVPTLFNWNTMIKAYSKSPQPEKGLLVYTQLRCRGVDPNMHTYPFTIKACTRLSPLSQVHGQIFKFGFDTDVYVVSSLIRTYSDCGSIELASQVFDDSRNRNIVSWTSFISGLCSHGLLDRARELFDGMPERNDVSWSAMISGYVQNDLYKEAIELFRNLRGHENAKFNSSLLVSILNACANLGASEEGIWVHSYIDKKGLEYGLELGTALVGFYAKCGCVESAWEVFHKIPSKDVMAWSAMVMGLAINGHSHLALGTFSEMLASGVTPNAITFIGVLSACNHGGLVDEGCGYFDAMSKIYGISPTIEHYGCMVDLLGRAGQIAEAERLIAHMPMDPDSVIWGALLNGCMMHGHVELGERVGRRLIKLEPEYCGRYVGLANMYAAMGRWEGVVKVRKMMKHRGITTAPGWSSIEMEGEVNRFVADDRSHPRSEEICMMLSELNKELESSI